MEFKFSELINIEELNNMAAKLYDMAGIPIGIIDVDGTIHVAAGWQRICTDFHRVNCQTQKRCAISDAYIAKHLHTGKYISYKCLNNMWDIAMPIIISEKHLATLFVGQFFYDDEIIDYDFFEKQAETFEFPKDEYMSALEEVPKFTKKKILDILEYYNGYINVIADSAIKNYELNTIKEELERKVEERTSELIAVNEEITAMNDELLNTLDNLKFTQNKLIESEKMASIGSLVAGMAHEVSTPVGIVLTSVTYLEKELEELESTFESGQMTKLDMKEFIDEAKEISDMNVRNLVRVDDLLRSFKQITSDQFADEVRAFHVKKYFDEIIMSMNSVIKNCNCNVRIECDDALKIVSNPGIFAQIVTNFIVNSINHAFINDDVGNINIKFEKLDDTYQLTYTDDGIGMEKDIIDKIFDPFFTTKRGNRGGTGLGLHIVYNIVTQNLKGEISCESSPGNGVSLVINFPIENRVNF